MPELLLDAWLVVPVIIAIGGDMQSLSHKFRVDGGFGHDDRSG